jgi:pyridoxamine 5'-phosphate oxidase
MESPLHSIRKQYNKGKLLENEVDKDPLKQLEFWIADAINAGVPEPTAMVLSTVGDDLRPSSRVVLLKGLDEGGIRFFTNYESRKGQQMLKNPMVSVLFFWPDLERQIRVEGTVSKLSSEESDVYFNSRPEASRISAVVSPQSRQIPNREWLENRADIARLDKTVLLRPSDWGGYIVIPEYFEFWQGREDRMHDRIVYLPDNATWEISRLSP